MGLPTWKHISLAQFVFLLGGIAFTLYMKLETDALRTKVLLLEKTWNELGTESSQSRILGKELKEMSAVKKSENSEKIQVKRPIFPCRVPPEYQLSAGCRVAGRRAEYSGRMVERYDRKNMALGRSQYGEDLGLVRKYFAGVRGGTFLEMGALDGERYSNTWYFEKELDWRGILIEGSPRNYAKLEQNRPQAIRVNAMVCSEARTLHWMERDNSAVFGVWEMMTDEFRRKWFPGMTEEKVKLRPTIECVRLTDILGRFGIRHVDLFSLDVEGAEMSVLKAIDFNNFSASVILVEIRPNSPSVEPLLSKAGYVRDKDIGPNAVFLHPDFKKSITGHIEL